MKFVLVVYLCIAGACESVYEQKLYDTRQECESASVEIMDYAQKDSLTVLARYGALLNLSSSSTKTSTISLKIPN